MLKKLKSMDYLKRTCDPTGERQVRVSLTPVGRRLGATRPDADFTAPLKCVTRLRDNLPRTAKAGKP